MLTERSGALHQGPTFHPDRDCQDQPSLRATLVHRNLLLPHLVHLQTSSARFQGGEASQGRRVGERVGTTRSYASCQDSARSGPISIDPRFFGHLLARWIPKLPLPRRRSFGIDWVSLAFLPFVLDYSRVLSTVSLPRSWDSELRSARFWAPSEAEV